MPNAWIVDAARTPFTRATKGALARSRPDELLATLVRHLRTRLPGPAREAIDDFVVGCAYPEAEQGRNVARAIALNAGLPDATPAMTLTRMCASSLEATAVAAGRIRAGEGDLVLVGGMESMTLIPMGGVKPSPNPALLARRPEAYVGMGQTAENVARRHGVSRADQDAWALRSHRRASAGAARALRADEILPVEGSDESGAPVAVSADDAVRPDASPERLAALKPAFAEDGTVTAGNACPTSDGASALVLASDEALRRHGLRPLGRFAAYAVAGVDPALMGIGPVEAVPRALRRAGIGVGDLDRIELNEAFASQVLAVMRALGLPEERTNVHGGAIALGHPLGATGARLVGTLLRQLRSDGGRWGLVTLCVGGGMGAALVLENAGA